MCCICWALLNVFALPRIFLHVLKDLLCKATLCNAKINTSDWNDAQFLTLHTSLSSWMANVLPSCWGMTNNTLMRSYIFATSLHEKRHKYFVWCGRASMKTINGQLLLVVILCVSRDSRCHRGEWTDAWKGFTSTWTLGKMPLSCAWGIITNTGCWTSVGIASHWCD